MAQAAALPEQVPALRMDRGTKLVVAALASITLLIHLRIAPGYGWARDELYFFVCADHLDWGYVDHPAGTVLLVALWRKLFGTSLLAFHVLSALGQVTAMVATAVLARAMGAGRFAISLACLAVMIAPVFLSLGALVSTNMFETTVWTLAVAVVARILAGGSERLWLLFGALCGVGLELKQTILALGFALVCALLLTGHFSCFRRCWIWLGGLVTLVLWLPYLFWESQHGWITLAAQASSNAPERNAVGLLEFSFRQAMVMNPITVLLWTGGLIWLLLYKEARQWRVFGVAFLIFYTLAAALHAKTYYTVAAYPVLFCAGAMVREHHFQQRPGQAWMKPLFFVVFGICGVLVAPLIVPLLSPAATVGYGTGLRANFPEAPGAPKGELWPPLADYTGWPEMTAAVAQAWRTLTPAEQARAGIFASNYAEASAIDLYGPQYGLPPAVSSHGSFWIWGPGRAANTDVLIIFGEHRYQVARECASVETAATFFNRYGRPFDNGPILVCRGLKRPLREIWPQLQYWGQD